MAQGGNMRPNLVLAALAGFACIALSPGDTLAAPDAPVAAGPASPAAASRPKTAKPPASDPAAISAGFWGDIKATTSSPDFATLKSAVGSADKSAATLSTPNTSGKQRIVDLAISSPADAAKVLTEATAASGDDASRQALATALTMVASPKTMEDAAALVPPDAQARVTEMRADLTNGIPGLPGIYLGDQPSVEGGVVARTDAPSGYSPVAGSSMGCPVR
jgi:hypothetical protein